MPAKKKGKTKGKKASVILAEALALFGPKGENWTTGTEHEHRDERYMFDGNEYYYRLEVEDAIQDRIDDVLAATVEVNGGVKVKVDTKAIEKKVKYIQDNFEKLPEQDLYCAIGAIHEVQEEYTTPCDEAERFLALAIDPTGEGGWGGTIVSNNDRLDEEDKKSFPIVRKWFQKSIKLAKAEGN